MVEAAAVVLFFTAVVLYALLLRWIAEYADRKGYSYWLFALGGLFISPVLAGVLALLLPDQSGPDHVPRAQR